MLLHEVVNGKRKTPFILIADSAEQDGFNLLRAIIQTSVDLKNEVHVVCFERPITFFKDSIKTTSESIIHYHDFFTDHRGWLGLHPQKDNDVKLGNIEASVDGSFVLVIDSFASMIINSGSTTEYKLLHGLLSSHIKTGKGTRQIIGLLHKDMLDELEVAQFSHLASTILQVKPPHANSHGRPLCYVKHRSIKGKICKEVEHYSVDLCNKLWSETFKETTASQPIEAADPMADVTTFKLSLGEKEKEARSQLVLPYMRNESAGETAASGIIHYEPDEADDWDEEDPDNDLNI